MDFSKKCPKSGVGFITEERNDKHAGYKRGEKMLRKHTLRSKLGEMKAAGLVGGGGGGEGMEQQPWQLGWGAAALASPGCFISGEIQ